ncbi:Prolyl endopeptidase [Acipenser ruthenus]|uniref:Prolyl endopeptidase n=1 Tax=Acipenser ruthenus TaxID=7906 RepID=A0A662YZP1_ACIRT|nr:Prolyl endopeptidase [Acipenser ruthenus]
MYLRFACHGFSLWYFGASVHTVRSVLSAPVMLEFSSCVHSKCLFICFLHDVKNVLKMYHLETGVHLKTVPLDVGSVVGFTGRKKDSRLSFPQVFYPSKDGTQIPMFIINKKGLKQDSILQVTAGMLAHKQNCFTDFQTAAEYLIRKGYTSPSKISINGGSNRGLLVAACVNQRPDLFGCAVAQVGVMDMLKFHKYSPLHNIKVPEEDGVQYPSMLLLTGDHDDRVVPLQSEVHRYLAADCPKQTNPLFIHVDTTSGHSARKPTSKVIQEVADMFAFISWIK